jgi:four helix bundle protein
VKKNAMSKSNEIKSYRDLIVWQKAVDLCIEVYRLASKFPKTEQFVLSDQIRRAAISVPSNIAEGHARHSRKDFARFLMIAQGSIAELETQLYLAVRMAVVVESDIVPLMRLSQEVSKMLMSLRSKLSSSP